MTRTKPATLMESTKAGTMFCSSVVLDESVSGLALRMIGRTRPRKGYLRTSKRELQTRPMKLLLCATRTASFTEIEPWPLLFTTAPGFLGSLLVPRSLHRSTGSKFPGQLSRLICTRLNAAHSSVVSNSRQYRYRHCET